MCDPMDALAGDVGVKGLGRAIGTTTYHVRIGRRTS
jgi:hypothetical protein